MILGDIADSLTRGVEAQVNTINEAFFEPVVRLGVTGLSRAGKTVFITSLVANLLNRGRMPGLRAAAEGRIQSVWLQPQPDDTVPRFDYESHIACLTGATPDWPESTRSISQLRLSFRVYPNGLLSGLTGPRTVHLDIVDYPGEWLLDLGLLEKSFDAWSAETLTVLENREDAADFLSRLKALDPSAPLDESTAKSLAAAYTQALTAMRAAGYSDCTPGRFLLPGDMAGSPVLTFTPLPSGSTPRGSLAREFHRRFDAYKQKVVKPFFREHFTRIDRQVVLVDALGAIHNGPKAVEDMRKALAAILTAFRPGQNAFLSRIFLGRRIEKILIAATKADHLHHTQHAQLAAIAEALLQDAKARADFAGAETHALAMAAYRATTEDRITKDDRTLDMVRGVAMDSGKPVALFPGRLPEDPSRILSPAAKGQDRWLDGDFNVMNFAPQAFNLKSGDGPPHIRLDRAAEFLIGDRLR